MTPDEIMELLTDWGYEPEAEMVDMIADVYKEAYEIGHDDGYNEGRDALEWQQQTERNRE